MYAGRKYCNRYGMYPANELEGISPAFVLKVKLRRRTPQLAAGYSLKITPVEIPLRVGKHHIELVKYDYAAHYEDIDVQVGANVINRKLVKLPTSEGLLIIETEPDGLEVLVDGLPADMSPAYRQKGFWNGVGCARKDNDCSSRAKIMRASR